jgi:hypothetical protein
MKDTLISVGLLAAGGVAIAAASGMYGKGSRAIRGMRYTLAYGGDNDSTIHVSGVFQPYSSAVKSAKKIAKRIGQTVEVREEGYDLVAFVEPDGRVDDGGHGKGSRASGSVVRWLAKKYGVSIATLAPHGDETLELVNLATEAWREQNGLPAPNSPLARGFFLDNLRHPPM